MQNSSETGTHQRNVKKNISSFTLCFVPCSKSSLLRRRVSFWVQDGESPARTPQFGVAIEKMTFLQLFLSVP